MNRQRAVPVALAWLRRVAEEALPACVDECADGIFALKQLPEVEVAIVSDQVIAEVHEEFMDVPGATDVITFAHGEIVMSADTAARYAAEHGHTPTEELALYIVHGLLHLNGFNDLKAGPRKRMHAVQERIWQELRARLGEPRKTGRKTNQAGRKRR